MNLPFLMAHVAKAQSGTGGSTGKTGPKTSAQHTPTVAKAAQSSTKVDNTKGLPKVIVKVSTNSEGKPTLKGANPAKVGPATTNFLQEVQRRLESTAQGHSSGGVGPSGRGSSNNNSGPVVNTGSGHRRGFDSQATQVRGQKPLEVGKSRASRTLLKTYTSIPGVQPDVNQRFRLASVPATSFRATLSDAHPTSDLSEVHRVSGEMNKTVVFDGLDFITAIQSGASCPTGTVVAKIKINPAFWSHTRISSLSALFQEVQVKKIKAHIRTNLSSINNGSLGYAFCRDPGIAMPDVGQTVDLRVFAALDSLQLPVWHDGGMEMPLLSNTTGYLNNLSQTDPRLYEFGFLMVVAMSDIAANLNPCNLYFEYSLAFTGPFLSPYAMQGGADFFKMPASQSGIALYPFGGASYPPTTFSNAGVSYEPNYNTSGRSTWIIPVGWWQVDVSIKGTGLVTPGASSGTAVSFEIPPGGFDIGWDDISSTQVAQKFWLHVQDGDPSQRTLNYYFSSITTIAEDADSPAIIFSRIPSFQSTYPYKLNQTQSLALIEKEMFEIASMREDLTSMKKLLRTLQSQGFDALDNVTPDDESD